MTKNAVQRLQKIEKDINTVISIFEISNQSQNGEIENSKIQFTQLPENSASKHSETSLCIFKPRPEPYYTQKSVCEPPKKNCNFTPRPSHANHLGESLVTIHKKSYPTPSSRSMIMMRASFASPPLFKSHVSTPLLLQSDIWQKQTDNLKENDGLSPAKTFYKFKNLDISESNEPECNMIMTPKKTTIEILEKSNFDNSQKNMSPSQKSALKQEGSDNVKNSKKENTKHFKREPQHSTQLISCDILKPKMEDNFRGTRVFLVRKNENLSDEKKKHDCMVMDTSPAFYIETRKSKVIQKMMNENDGTSNIKMNITSRENFRNNSPYDKKRQNCQDNSKKVVFTYTTSNPFIQKISKSEESEEMELWTTKLDRNLEKSNEKLVKMKVIKELAINVAKHLKQKYDDIQKSKAELQTRLQELEKDNERLNLEVKQAKEMKRALQQKMEGYMSSTTNMEDDSETQDDWKEEFKLKTIKTQLSKDVSDKGQFNDKIQKERLQGNTNNALNQETLSNELHRLADEKSDLLLKLNQKQRMVEERNSQIEKLNNCILELEKELQNLKTKADIPQQINEELQRIRENFAESEKQVFEFQKKIEILETIQIDLIHKITEYDGRLKSNQKEIDDLKGLKEKLESQLEDERDVLRIKNKIIDDQQETIRQLKGKSEDVKNIQKRNASLERILNIEREEKLELQEAVELLKRRKDEMKMKLKDLEKNALFDPQKVLEDLKKTRAILQELESQVQMKQNEWTREQQLLYNAKEQACKVAEFATEKLIETTNELQRQSKEYKCLQKMVADDFAIRKKRNHAKQKKERYQQMEETQEPDITFSKDSDS